METTLTIQKILYSQELKILNRHILLSSDWDWGWEMGNGKVPPVPDKLKGNAKV